MNIVDVIYIFSKPIELTFLMVACIFFSIYISFSLPSLLKKIPCFRKTLLDTTL